MTGRDAYEENLERKVSDALAKVDRAKAEHAEALRILRKYRREKAKEQDQT